MSRQPPEGCIWLPAEPAHSTTGCYGYAIEVRGEKVFVWRDRGKTWDCHEAEGVVVALLRRLVRADADLDELLDPWLEILRGGADTGAQSIRERLPAGVRESLGVSYLPELPRRARDA